MELVPHSHIHVLFLGNFLASIQAATTQLHPCADYVEAASQVYSPVPPSSLSPNTRWKGCKEEGARLFSVVPREGTRHKLKHRKLQFSYRKASGTVRRPSVWEQAVQKGSVSTLGDAQRLILSDPL